MKSILLTKPVDAYPTETRLMTLLNRVSGIETGLVQVCLDQELDWHYMLQSASLLGASPLFYYHLKNFRTSCSQEIWDGFHNQYHLTLAKNMQLNHACDQITGRLSDQGIPCMGLKGAVLSRELYPTPALRPMFDIDLLVKKEDLPGVDKTIRKLGYMPHGKETLMDPPPYHYHLHYTRETAAPVILEVHWGLGEKNRYNLDESGIWARARQSSSGPWFEMSDDDTLLYLAMHFFKHFLFKRLSWLCDIHEWIVQKEIHWDLVIERARSQSISTFLAYTLTIFQDFYGKSLPVRIDEILTIGYIRKKLLDRYLCAYDMFHPMEENSWFKKRLFAFSSIDRLSDRLRFTWDAVRRDLD